MKSKTCKLDGGEHVTSEQQGTKELLLFQGEQLRWVLQLQVLHAVPGLFAALLPSDNCDRSSVLH